MQNGQFVWYDVMTTDPQAAKAFYGAVIGWKMQDFPGMHGDYTVLHLEDGDMGVAGIMALPESARAMGARPAWTGYVSVDDVDAYAEKLKAAGGTVHVPPADIPGGVGRFAVVADPQGAVFNLFKPNPPPGEVPPPPAPGALGTIGWRELMTTDHKAAMAFYEGLLGWRKGDGHDMGEHGVYQLFHVGDGPPVGGMMDKPESIQAPPYWGYYIMVDSAKAAAERIKANGGQVLNGPMPVPTNQWIVQALDPQGAFFAVLSDKE